MTMAHIKEDENGEIYIDDPWYVEDVKEAANDLGIEITNEEAEDILCSVANSFDANIGINWEVFYYHINAMKGFENA